MTKLSVSDVFAMVACVVCFGLPQAVMADDKGPLMSLPPDQRGTSKAPSSRPSPTRPKAKAPTPRPVVRAKPVVKPSGRCTKVAAPQHIQWSSLTFKGVRKMSIKSGCPVLLDMFATWCGPCKRYDRRVFNRPDVAGFVHKNFIPMRRDGMKGEGKMLAKRYNCVTYPCILVLDAKGKEIDRITGYMRPGSFVRRLSQIKRGKATLASLLPQLKQNPNDMLLRFRVGYRLAYRGDARCVGHLLAVGKNPPPQYRWLGARALYVLGRIYYRNTRRDYRSAIRVFQLYLKKYPRARKARRVQGLIHWCQRRLRR